VPSSVVSPSPVPTPAQQVVTVLAPLRSSVDGTHEVTIGLEPDGLGTVKATVTVSAGQVVVRLGADNDQARDALRQALPLLKHELGGDGSSASVLLAGDGQPHRRTFTDNEGSSTDGLGNEDVDGAVATTATRPRGAASGHIDLHL
jgi:flagellar hook-length control protein FliK